MKNDQSLTTGLTKAKRSLRKLTKHAVLLFVLFLLAVYGFTLYRIDMLTKAEPSASAVAAERTNAPHIDPTLVKRLEQLNDNSVNVRTLFDQARNNPFKE